MGFGSLEPGSLVLAVFEPAETVFDPDETGFEPDETGFEDIKTGSSSLMPSCSIS